MSITTSGTDSQSGPWACSSLTTLYSRPLTGWTTSMAHPAAAFALATKSAAHLSTDPNRFSIAFLMPSGGSVAFKASPSKYSSCRMTLFPRLD